MAGVLYIVSTPIGNRDDITIRALKVLKGVDEVICEELKEGRKLLNQYGIDKPLRKLNEHNEKRDTPQIIKELKTGKRFALISDCGTPVFADTGGYLLKEAISSKIQLIPVPGASSLMAALVVSGISLERFIYYGFLSPKREGRRKELFKIKSLLNTIDADRNMPVVLLDTPYRLLSLLIDIADIVGKETSIILCMDMTTHTEEILRGRAYEILTRIKEGEKKREFVLIIKPKGKIPEHE
ncbi:MAG: 16S rRNA (cytidine(1402)-2'-O)-methyltransferase [Nitrospinota bacterium]